MTILENFSISFYSNFNLRQDSTLKGSLPSESETLRQNSSPELKKNSGPLAQAIYSIFPIMSGVTGKTNFDLVCRVGKGEILAKDFETPSELHTMAIKLQK